ncbi:MAG: nitrous oxide reductase accessory protein NosL [Sulfurimonas sp.]|jgi:nitrous oxide reductase accessory protein NosL
MKKLITGMLLASTFTFTTLLTADDSYTMNYDKNTTCLVRQFKVYKEPKWVSKVNLSNGKEIYFSSPKSMIEFYLRPGKWDDIGVKSEEDFKEILVTDFATMKPIDAKGAFYVYGSNVISPAGDDLVPFATYDAAKNFAKEHNGKRVLHLNEISDALIKLLNGNI